MPPPSKKRPLAQISVRASTHAKLQAAARRQGEHTSTLLDSIIVAWLDEELRKN
jgi:hypothetical protein